jgi:hypothetical protein
MSLNDYPKETRLNENTFCFISSLLVAAMLTCCMLTVGSLVGQVMFRWPSGGLGVVAFLVALDRLYTYRRL